MRRAPAALALGLGYLFVFLPVLPLVLFSFQGAGLPVPPFDGPSLQWYARALSDRRLADALANSLAVAVGSSLAATVLGFLAAYGLARFRLPGARAIEGLLLLPLTVSYLIIGVGLLVVLNALGLPRSLWTVGLGHVVINLPVCLAVCRSQLGDRAQAGLERAARDLGAGEAQVLLLVTVPLVWPALLASFCLAFTLSWDEFIIAFLLTRFDVTLPVVIWSLLRTGLNPVTNAAGSLVFGLSAALVLLAELLLARRRAAR